MGLDGKTTGLDFLLGHWYLAIETDIISVGESSMKGISAIPVAAQQDGNFVLGICFGSSFRMGDIFVIGDAAILRQLQVVEGKYEVGIIPLTDI